MEIFYALYVFIGINIATSTHADECVPHHVANGNVSLITDAHHSVKVWKIKCNPGFTIFGADRIKCRNGMYSDKFPVCTSIGGCNIDDMPEIKNGKKVVEHGTRGSVFKYRCNSPYRLFGHHRPISCGGGNKWNVKHIPVCTKLGCDEKIMKTIANGESARMMRGRVYEFRCKQGTVMQGSPIVYCDGRAWNGTKPECLSAPEHVYMEAIIDGVNIAPKEQMDDSVGDIILRPHLNHKITIVCKDLTHGKMTHPAPEFRFLKNGQPLNEWSSEVKTISLVAKEDETLNCVAKNHMGEKLSNSVSLEVLHPPPGIPILTMNPGNSHVVDLSGNSISIVVNSNSEKIGVKAGQDVYLECLEPTSEQNNLKHEIVFKHNGKVINQNVGSNSLHLSDVSQQTDGVYHCELINVVGKHSSNFIELKAIYPPSVPKIQLSSLNSESTLKSHFNHVKDVVEAIVDSGQEIQIECKFDKIKNEPNEINELARKITIRKNGNPISFPKEYYNGIYTRVTSSNNGDKYECEVDNRFYTRTSDTVEVNVQFPPQNLFISGPDSIKQQHGHKFKVSCQSDVGNPAAKLTFKLFEIQSSSLIQTNILNELIAGSLVEVKESNERFVDRQRGMTENNHSSGTEGWETSRELLIHPRIVKKVKGNKIKVQCVSNDNISNEMEIDIIRKPERVVVHGPTKLRYNEHGEFQCVAHPEYISPKPSISWRIQMGTITENLMGSDETNEDHLSQSSLYISPETAIRDYKKNAHHDLVVECLVSHPELGSDFVSYTHMVEVLYPPGTPEIHGLNEGSVVKEGKNQRLLCTTKAGKPPAKLVWYMGEHMMDSQYSVNGDTVEAKITFVPRIEDNGKELRCEARNDAVASPVSNTLVLGVDRVTSTTTQPETTMKQEEVSNLLDEENDANDEYVSNHEYIENNDYPDYGYDDPYDYAINWTQHNSIEEYHPEETDELTTDKPDIIVEELPSRPDDSINSNILHSNNQNVQIVDLNDDPDIKVRSSEQYQEEPRSGKQDTLDVALDALETKKIGKGTTVSYGSSAVGLGGNPVLSVAMFVVLVHLPFH